MPGSPSTSPNFGAPRYADSDIASFSAQVNGVTDTFDAGAVKTTDGRLSDQRVPTDGSVTTAKLANGAVTSPKLSDPTTVHMPGDLVLTAAASRAGCLLANAAPFNPATYPALFIAIGYTYGTDPGTGHPKLPGVTPYLTNLNNAVYIKY